MCTHSIQKVALAEETNAFGVVGFWASAGLGIPRNGILPIEFATFSVESWIVIVPRMSWSAMSVSQHGVGIVYEALEIRRVGAVAL